MDIVNPSAPQWLFKSASVQQFCTQLTVELGSYNQWSKEQTEYTVAQIYLPDGNAIKLSFFPFWNKECALFAKLEGM